ncbi:MAG: hypothetical protein WAM14_13415 [Candidatus Nitrosopolaris sp.]
MIRFLEGLQNRPVIVIVSTILLVGFFSLGMRFASADPSHQTQYNVGYTDGHKNAECDSKHCHGHGYDRTVPSGHTTAYDNAYFKGYQDGWNKDSGMGRINETIAKSQEVSNNNHGCNPTHQFCAMTADTS